jgi:hypothetical protein
MPCLRPAPDQAQGAVGIGSGVTLDRVGRPLLAREPVFQRECGDAEPVQELRRRLPLGFEHQKTMTTAWHHHDTGAGGILGLQQGPTSVGPTERRPN